MTEDVYHQIERYADGLMDREEASDFEARLAQEPELMESLKHYRNTRDALRAGAFQAEKHRIRQLDQPQTRMNSQMLVRIAAVLVIGFPILMFLLLQRPTGAELAEEYFEPYPDRVTTMAAESTTWEKAMSAYNREAYTQALEELNTLEKQRIGDAGLVTLYSSICLLALDSCEQALPKLQSLSAQSSNLSEAAQWYAILAALECDKTGDAMQMLEQYLNQPEVKFNRSKAEELLEALN